MNDHESALNRRVLTIRTPENLELTYALAGPASRAAAYAVDVVAMGLVGHLTAQVLITTAMVLLNGVTDDAKAWAAAAVGVLLFLLYNGYFVLFEWLWSGQTPGKRLLHVQVVRQGGYALRFNDTLLRNLLRVVDFLPAFYGVGLVSLLTTRDCQRVGDLVAGTLVVYQDPAEIESLLPEGPADSSTAPAFPAAAVAAVPEGLLEIAGLFLRSRDEAAPRARQEVAAELAGLIREATGLEPGPGRSVESFLEALVRQSERGLPSSSPRFEEDEIPS